MFFSGSKEKCSLQPGLPPVCKLLLWRQGPPPRASCRHRRDRCSARHRVIEATRGDGASARCLWTRRPSGPSALWTTGSRNPLMPKALAVAPTLCSRGQSGEAPAAVRRSSVHLSIWSLTLWALFFLFRWFILRTKLIARYTDVKVNSLIAIHAVMSKMPLTSLHFYRISS